MRAAITVARRSSSIPITRNEMKNRLAGMDQLAGTCCKITQYQIQTRRFAAGHVCQVVEMFLVISSTRLFKQERQQLFLSKEQKLSPCPALHPSYEG